MTFSYFHFLSSCPIFYDRVFSTYIENTRPCFFLFTYIFMSYFFMIGYIQHISNIPDLVFFLFTYVLSSYYFMIGYFQHISNIPDLVLIFFLWHFLISYYVLMSIFLVIGCIHHISNIPDLVMIIFFMSLLKPGYFRYVSYLPDLILFICFLWSVISNLYRIYPTISFYYFFLLLTIHQYQHDFSYVHCNFMFTFYDILFKSS